MRLRVGGHEALLIAAALAVGVLATGAPAAQPKPKQVQMAKASADLLIGGRGMTQLEKDLLQPYLAMKMRALQEKAGLVPKRAEGVQQICPSQYLQYILVNPNYDYISRTTACQNFGLVPAGVDSEADALGIINNMFGAGNCGNTVAWIEYYYGIETYDPNSADSCVILDDDLVVDFNSGGVCTNVNAPVLCSELPLTTTIVFTTTLEVTSTSSDTTTSIITGTLSLTDVFVTSTTISTTGPSLSVITSTSFVTYVITYLAPLTETSLSTTATVDQTTTQTATNSIVTTVVMEYIYTSTLNILPTCPTCNLDSCPCYPSRAGFVLIKNPLPYYQAECACEQLGLELADVTSESYLFAQEVAGNCLGCRNSAWIRNWNGQDFDNSCVALYFNGALAVPETCDRCRPVLCRAPKFDICHVCQFQWEPHCDNCDIRPICGNGGNYDWT